MLIYLNRSKHDLLCLQYVIWLFRSHIVPITHVKNNVSELNKHAVQWVYNWIKSILNCLIKIIKILIIYGFPVLSGDSLSHHNGQLFSTLDKDNDEHNKTSCAQEYRGGWWYHHCYHTNLNGLHENGTKESIVWVDPVSLRAVEMKIRRV